MEAFEITLIGPRLKFYAPAVVAFCGAPFSLTINGEPAPTWTRHILASNTELAIGTTEIGARGYLAVYGGLPGVAKYLGSKSTTPSLNWGGYQGRCMRAGDFLYLEDPSACGDAQNFTPYALPAALIPPIDRQPHIYALPGPWFSSEFLTKEGQEHLYSTSWTVSFNSSRTSVRLDGDPPAWSRKNGGEGGSHPSNMIGFGCPLGGVSFTGDAGLVFTADCPNQTGYIVTNTVARSDLWRLGQLRPGDVVKFQETDWDGAMELDRRVERFLDLVKRHVQGNLAEEGKGVLPNTTLDMNLPSVAAKDGILFRRKEVEGQAPSLTVRQAGDRGVLCCYGQGTVDINLRARVQQVSNLIHDAPPAGFSPHCGVENFSFLIHYNPHIASQDSVIQKILELDQKITQVGASSKIPSRLIHLPALFDAEEIHQDAQRYMMMQRPSAAYLPDNVDFIRRSNGLKTREDVKAMFFETPHLVNAVGWLMGLPIYLQIDPRKRPIVPKYNPSRNFTHAGALGSGGNTSSIYPNDS